MRRAYAEGCFPSRSPTRLESDWIRASSPLKSTSNSSVPSDLVSTNDGSRTWTVFTQRLATGANAVSLRS